MKQIDKKIVINLNTLEVFGPLVGKEAAII